MGMKVMRGTGSWISCLALAFLLCGCAVPLSKRMEETGGLREAFRRHLFGGGAQAVGDLRVPEETEADDGDFPVLPNPVLLMWVHPHISGGSHGVPIPGYLTAFPMYERDHIALPHEVAR